MEYKKCWVFGCGARGGKQFNFPRTLERALQWKEFCNNPKIEKYDASKLHDYCRVCEKHFDVPSFTYPSSGRLLRSALPTLFPPSNPLDPESEPPVLTSPSNFPPPPNPDPIPSTSFAPSTPPPIELPPSPSSYPPTSSPPLGKVSSKKKRKSISSYLGVTRIEELTPRKRMLCKELQRKNRAVNRLRMATLKLKKSFSEMSNIDKFDFVKVFKTSLSNSSLMFLTSVLKGSKCKPQGRRWTHSEKIFALSLFKKSPRTYKFIQSQIPLPSRSTLSKLLTHIDFSSGINQEILEQIKESTQRKKPASRFCTLIFDEMSLKPLLTYNREKDQIDGFTDHGTKGRSSAVAKEALVFMVRGIQGNWKQPVAYYYSHGSTPAEILSELIKEVLLSIKETGLIVVATVCDMARSNVKALQILGSSFLHPYFLFEGETIFTIFDPPHLLKCFRNLFLKYKVRLSVNIGEQPTSLTAEWEHIRVLDRQDHSVGFLPLSIFNLTEAHLSPTPRQKMRVYLAAEVFSRRVAAGIHALVGNNVLGINGLATAQFLMDVDSAFDSLNGSMGEDKRRPLKYAVTEGGPHVAFWKKMLVTIDSWEFIGKKKVIRPPSQEGWLASMRAMISLWDRLRRKDFLHISTRNFNQDPIENLFNIVRQNCGCNHHPNAKQFQDALKTAVINNLVSNQAKGNTAEDGCDILTDLSSLFQTAHEESRSTSRSKKMELNLSNKKLMSVAFVGYQMAANFLKGTNCEHCRADLATDPLLLDNIYLSFLFEQEQTSICPSESFLSSLGVGITAAMKALQDCPEEKKLSMLIAPKVTSNDTFQFFRCECHKEDFKAFFVSTVSEVAIRRYCIENNRTRLQKL